jgi:hypothetical protein
VALLREPLDGLDEPLGHRRNHRRGGDRIAEAIAHEAHEAAFGLQQRHIAVEVHSVDAVDLQHDMVSDQVGDILRYRGSWAPSVTPLTHRVRSLERPNAAPTHSHAPQHSEPSFFCSPCLDGLRRSLVSHWKPLNDRRPVESPGRKASAVPPNDTMWRIALAGIRPTRAHTRPRSIAVESGAIAPSPALRGKGRARGTGIACNASSGCQVLRCTPFGEETAPDHGRRPGTFAPPRTGSPVFLDTAQEGELP